MIRLFVALPIPEEITDALGALEAGIPGANWVEMDNMHLTLRFIGEVPRPDAEEIAEALAEVNGAPFELTLSGIGTFETARHTRAIWVGTEPAPDLHRLRASVESAVVRTGQPPEGRRFTPHVTLARCRNPAEDRVGRFVQENNRLKLGPFLVESFALFSSQLGRSGPTYTIEAEYPL